jgi:hypothetical protein
LTHPGIHLHIAVHPGDIIVEDEYIYVSGINLAA